MRLISVLIFDSCFMPLQRTQMGLFSILIWYLIKYILTL